MSSRPFLVTPVLAILGAFALPARADDPSATDGGAEALVQACLAAWEKAHHPDGPLTLFSHQVEDRGAFSLMALTLGRDEGRTITGACRIKDGAVTHTYD